MYRAPTTVLPKPCLKQRSETAFYPQKKHAHFPPPSQEAQRYSGIEYDRTPITVVANELALPARGCPGRTFDDVDGYRHHHHSKKHFKSGEVTKSSSSLRHRDEVHPNYFMNEAAAASWPMDLSQSRRISSGAHAMLPPLSTIHGDMSESDGDISPPMSESDGQPSLTRSHHPRRLRKAGAADRQHASGDRLQRTSNLSPPSPTSTFASYPGSNSCLGGF